MDALPHAADRGPSPLARAATGLLLGLTAGALAALITPRRPRSEGDDHALP